MMNPNPSHNNRCPRCKRFVAMEGDVCRHCNILEHVSERKGGELVKLAVVEESKKIIARLTKERDDLLVENSALKVLLRRYMA